jgi:hypothetical protein
MIVNQKFAWITVTADDNKMTLTDEQGSSVQIVQGTMSERIGRTIWEWTRDHKAKSGYAIDDPQGAREVVLFYHRGTASNGEKRIIEAILASDEFLRLRFEDAFPALATAVNAWRHNNKAFIEAVENEAKANA